MNWEKQIDKTTHYVRLNHFQVIFGSHQGSGHTDHAAVASHAEFLDGRFHKDIRKLFGENVLAEMIAAVQKADSDPNFSAKIRKERTLLETLNAIPLDATLAGLIGNPATENGGRNYGNGGGYKTILKSDTLTITFERNKGALSPNAGGAKKEFHLPSHGSHAVALHDHFYIVANDDLIIVKPDGSVYQERNSIFGGMLRINHVFRHADVIFVSYRWFHGNHPKGWLRYEFGKGFTGRWVEIKK